MQTLQNEAELRAVVGPEIPGTPETVRVNGRASLSAESELLERLAARGKSAVLAIRVEVEEVFSHCAKAFLRSRPWCPYTWGKAHEASFGKMFVATGKARQEAAVAIDQAVQAECRENL